MELPHSLDNSRSAIQVRDTNNRTPSGANRFVFICARLDCQGKSTKENLRLALLAESMFDIVQVDDMLL